MRYELQEPHQDTTFRARVNFIVITVRLGRAGVLAGALGGRSSVATGWRPSSGLEKGAVGVGRGGGGGGSGGGGAAVVVVADVGGLTSWE